MVILVRKWQKTATTKSIYWDFMKFTAIILMLTWFILRKVMVILVLKWQFYKKALKAVGKIPYAITKSYKEVANNIGSPSGHRAVANANAINPIPIVVPCHRVIKSNGELGGYGGGNKLKKDLLKFERANLS